MNELRRWKHFILLLLISLPRTRKVSDFEASLSLNFCLFSADKYSNERLAASHFLPKTARNYA